MARQVLTEVHVLVQSWEVETLVGAGQQTKRLLHEVKKDYVFTSGTTDYTENDRVWSNQYSFTTTPDTIDISGTLLSKLDASNNNVFVDPTVFLFTNEESSGAGYVTVGAGSNPYAGCWAAAGDGAKVFPQGLLLMVAPGGFTAPVAGTGDILTMAASAGTIAGKVLVAGRSA